MERPSGEVYGPPGFVAQGEIGKVVVFGSLCMV